MRGARGKIYADPNIGFAWLRTIGAITVVVDHCCPLLEPNRLTIFPASWHASPGYVALMGFFAMSGFQIQDSWTRDPSWWRYSARRLLRILPPLVVVLCTTVFVIGPLVTTWPAHAYWTHVQTWRYLVGTTVLFLLQHQLPGVFSGNPYPYSVNGALWTLPIEMLGYALVLLAGVLISFGVSRLALFGVLGGMVYADSVFQATFEYHGRPLSLLVVPIGSAVAFLVPFVIGMILRTYRDKIPLRPWVAIVLFLAWIPLSQTVVSRYLLAVMASYGAITLASHWPKRWERAGALVYGSYGLYIWAFPIQQLLVMAGVRQLWLLIALAVPAAFLAGQLSWRFVEEPTQRLRRYLRKPPPPEPRPEAETTMITQRGAPAAAPSPSSRGAG
ncbi:acyltransferase [Amycolatopsis cynarae]|uniref:Acyltransferase n=1 Tax=Amycolatopsis cynarae TaxID=2995223 RepID=A0ABY7B0M8_9PSEU|nr:acyltransferase [Amycolatopsis sp. HUAS 11-8]WAL65510.1 acyltransferase [Amycolatopsis sp. HUAS 11-8]